MVRFCHRLTKSLEAHPAGWLAGYMMFSIVVWTLQCSLLQNIQGLDALEAVSWGGQHALGHAKHPPFSGWCAEFFSRISGRADWGLYLACQLALVTGVSFVYKTVRLFFDRYFSAVSAILLYFLFYYLPSWMKFSTYFVEIALCPVAAYCFFAAAERKRWYWWGLFGLCCGIGMLNKYSFGLQMAGFAVIFFCVKKYRTQFFPGGVLAALVLGAVFYPHAHWLAEHDFICLRHVQDRMQEARNWYDTFVVIGAILYPAVNALAVLFVAWFAERKETERKSADRDLLRWTLILSLLPGVFYLVLDLSGKSVIVMWFCSAASWTGALAAAVFPFKITPGIWKRIYLLLCIATLAVFAGTTADLIFRTGKRLHMRPEAIIEPALAVWHQYRSDAVPVVYGGRWYASVVENYLPYRPPACASNEPVDWERCKAKIWEEGALLIGDPPDFDAFERDMGIRVSRVPVAPVCKSIGGRVWHDRLFVGYFPSRREREAGK